MADQYDTPHVNEFMIMFSNVRSDDTFILQSVEHEHKEELNNEHNEELNNENYDDLPDLVLVENEEFGSIVNYLQSVGGDNISNEYKEKKEDEHITMPESVIPGTSTLESTIDIDGNIEIKVVYNKQCIICSVCEKLIIGNIISCENSHALCGECIIGMEKANDIRCPWCRSSSRGRNYLIENALKGMIKMCPNKLEGCNHKSYSWCMDEHLEVCKYAEMVCPWCDGYATPNSLYMHAEYCCINKFSLMSCANRIDFIKSEKVKNIFILLDENKSRFLYLEKTDTMCNLLCAQETSDDDNISSLVIKYDIDIGSEHVEEIKNQEIIIPIYEPKKLIQGNILLKSIPLNELINYNNIIIINGYNEVYPVGSRWMTKNKDGKWYRSKICRRSYNPDKVLVRYDLYPTHIYDEWIKLEKGESDRIRSLDSNDERTTDEEYSYYETLNEEERYLFAIERSLDYT
jgi:hypothetical protein